MEWRRKSDDGIEKFSRSRIGRFFGLNFDGTLDKLPYIRVFEVDHRSGLTVEGARFFREGKWVVNLPRYSVRSALSCTVEM